MATDIIDRIMFTLSSGRGVVTPEDSAEFGRALTDLADRIERAVSILRQLVDLADPQDTPTEFRLTPRELELLNYLAEGRANQEIARLCWISENTVKFHMKNIFRKLHVRERGQAMMIARAMQKWIEKPRLGR
ncbi:MAG: helix-turn-helix transcriptional regulator [bacterium]